MAGTAGAKSLRLEEPGMYESLDVYMAGLEEQRGEWASEDSQKKGCSCPRGAHSPPERQTWCLAPGKPPVNGSQHRW